MQRVHLVVLAIMGLIAALLTAAWTANAMTSTSLFLKCPAVSNPTAGQTIECVYEAAPSPTPTVTATPTPTPTATATPTTEPPTTTRPFVAYGESSFLQSELDGAPQNATLTTEFRAFMKRHPDQVGVNHPRLIGMGGNNWGMPFDVGTCDDPVWKLDAGGNLPAQWEHLRTTGFHARADMQFTGTSDSPFVVVDKCNGFSVWGAGGKKLAGNVIDFTAAGAFEHASNGLDRRNPFSNSTKNERSRGVIPDSMVIRKDLMDWAKANNSDLGHVLELFIVESDSTKGHEHPMVGSESGKAGFGAEGWRVAVSPSVDLAARTCSPEARVIARTLQNYGMYIGDNSGSTSNLKVEQEATAGAVWGGVLQRDELAGCITWDDFVVIKPGWPDK